MKLKPLSNGEILQLLCGDLNAAIKASSVAAAYADETANSAILAANYRIEMEFEHSRLTEKLAAAVAEATASEAKTLAIATLNTARTVANQLVEHPSEVARALEEKAKTLSASVRLAAEQLRADGKAQGAEALKMAINARIAAVAAVAAATAATDKVCGHFKAAITPSGSPEKLTGS